MIKGIFDTHAHYDDEQFSADRDELLESIHTTADKIITCGCDAESIKNAAQISEKFDFIYFAAGFHPERENEVTQEEFELLEEYLSFDKCVAVGEIGLDYHWDGILSHQQQIELFEKQIMIAKEHDLPVIVHDREAHQDTFDVLKKYRPKGVLHCYSGSSEMMKEIVKLGMYIGIGGVVTFKNARKSLDVAALVPVERLLLETDAPYLSPVPFRGKRCDSSMIEYTAQTVAAIKGMDTQDLVNIAHQNACELFGIK